MNKSSNNYNKACLLLGSNLGSKAQNIIKAENAMSLFLKIIKFSSFYESNSWGYDSENSFINRALLVESLDSPLELLEKIQNLETKMSLFQSCPSLPELVRLSSVESMSRNSSPPRRKRSSMGAWPLLPLIRTRSRSSFVSRWNQNHLAQSRVPLRSGTFCFQTNLDDLFRISPRFETTCTSIK